MLRKLSIQTDRNMSGAHNVAEPLFLFAFFIWLCLVLLYPLRYLITKIKRFSHHQKQSNTIKSNNRGHKSKHSFEHLYLTLL